jgi:rubrerythrin
MVDEPTAAQEVKPLMEPERKPEHCGRRMRKFSTASPSTGALLTVWMCDVCGTQQREGARP